jgi:hypothetical protein
VSRGKWKAYLLLKSRREILLHSIDEARRKENSERRARELMDEEQRAIFQIMEKMKEDAASVQVGEQNERTEDVRDGMS